MSRHRAAAVALLAVTTACSASVHRADVLQVGSTPAGATTPPATLAPTIEPTVVASPTRRPATASPTPPARSAAPATPRASVPTVSPTPTDTRPTATVVVVNHASMSVDVLVGDLTFHLASGQASARRTAQVDPGGNTGVEAHRSDDTGCGYGGPKYLRPGHSYTLTLKDQTGCTHNGTHVPGPAGTLTKP